MRIIGGTHKGRKLQRVIGNGIRPLTDSIKESIFNILSNEIREKCVLDLFAGSGSFGLEALSRGAREVDFVDHMSNSIQTIKKSVSILGMERQAEIIQMEALLFLKQYAKAYDIVFIDPPFSSQDIFAAINEFSIAKRILLKDGWLIIRYFHKNKIGLDSLALVKEKKYGENRITFYQNS